MCDHCFRFFILMIRGGANIAPSGALEIANCDKAQNFLNTLIVAFGMSFTKLALRFCDMDFWEIDFKILIGYRT